MARYFEPYIIMVLGMLICDYSLSEITDILIFLCALILISLLSIIRHEKIKAVLFLISFIPVFFFPNAQAFIPALLYFGIYSRKYLPTAAISLLSLLIANPALSNPFFLIVFLAFFSGYLAVKSRQKEALEQKTKTLRDSMVEREIVLNQKNQQLLEAQHDQVHLATLSERNRIAREIHDNVGHQLSRAILQTGALIAVSKDDNTKALLTSLKGTLDEAMTNIRSSVHDLHDESIDLENSLRTLCTEFTFCPVELHCETGRNIPKDVKYCFITIVKEALNNTARHSNATSCSVYVHEHPGFYQLLVEDNGSTASASKANSSGIGLINMEDRVKALGGHITISSTNGFRIFISIPKK